MTMHGLVGRILGSAMVAAMVLSAGMAEAKSVYRWKTDEGTYAFTDDPKQIPAKYRDRARRSTLRPLQTYRNYTPAQDAATGAHVKQMREAARYFSELNARLDRRQPVGVVVRGVPTPESDAVVRSSTSGRTFVEAQTGLDGDDAAPLVIEEKRFYVPGENVTRRDTIVRRGDRILAITKPLPNQQNISDIRSESVLPD